MSDDDPWPPEPQVHCWVCRQPPVYHDIFGIGWCELHFSDIYLGRSPDDLPD